MANVRAFVFCNGCLLLGNNRWVLFFDFSSSPFLSGSIKNKSEEDAKRNKPGYEHLNEDLHVEISTFASPSEAHARLALALSEVRAYLIPDSNDQIRQQQMRDIKMIKMSGTSTNTPSSVSSEVNI